MKHLNSLVKLLSFILIIFPCCVISQQQHLPIRNYTVKDFKVEGQNWSILQDKRGVMYFGTNYGVFEYDGNNWNIISKSNEVYYTGLAMDSIGRVYVGVVGDFGYLAPDDFGRTRFHSLTDGLNEKDKNFDFIKRIFVIGNGVFFCNPSKIFKWSNGKIIVYNLPHLSGSFSFVNGVLYWREKGRGIMKMVNGKPQLVKGGEEFANEKVGGIISYYNNKILLITETKGVYTYDGNIFSSFKSPIDDLLIQNQVNKVEKLENGNIVLNTEFNGAYVLNSKLEVMHHFNKANGLCDDNVWFSYSDKEDNLWLALNSIGISKVAYNSPISLFDEADGINSSVQSVIRHNGSLYVGTGKGTLLLSENNNDTKQGAAFKEIKNLDAITNNFISIGKDLLAATFKGIYQIDGYNAFKITDGSFHHLYISHSDSSIVFAVGDEGLYALKKVNGKWILAKKFKEINEGIMKISDLSGAERSPGKNIQLWLGCINNGLLKVTFDGGSLQDHITIERFDTLQGMPQGNNTDIFQIGGQNVFTRNNIVLKFDSSKKRFVPEPVFGEKFMNGNAGIISLSEIPENKVWINYIEGLSSVSKLAVCEKSSNGNFLIDSLPFLGIDIGIIWQIYPDKNGIVWFCGEHGLLRYDSKISKNYKIDFPALIRKVIVSGDSTLFYGNYFEDKIINNRKIRIASLSQPKAMIPVLTYATNSLTFEYTAASFENENSTQFQYFLEGFDKNWSAWKLERKAVYTNLSEGNYKFHIKAKNIHGHESSEGVYEFVILPPWYRTTMAYISYGLLFAGLFYLGVHLNSRRLKAANIFLQKKINEATLEIRQQKEQIEDKNKDITDSIRYAKRLQTAILKPENTLTNYFDDGFILFKPKDIVSGDFYWFEKFGNLSLIAAADCTGHGVPGAFMSIIGCNLLSQAVNEYAITQPAAILNSINKGLTKVLQQKGDVDSFVTDGMDIALCTFDSEKMTVEYSGAFNPMWLIRDNKIIEFTADKFPVGAFVDSTVRMFKCHEIPVQKGDMIYLFSDGYADQFGGPAGKKLKYKPLQALLLENHEKNGAEQKAKLNSAFEKWIGNLEQIDDVLVIGIRI